MAFPGEAVLGWAVLPEGQGSRTGRKVGLEK